MTNVSASLAYRQAATQQASVVGLVVALYDTLLGDLRRAAAAMIDNNIQLRCDQLVHGFSVLQQLDAMIDMDGGGEAAASLRRFYRHIRGQMLVAQFKLSPAILHEQIRIVLDVRQAWEHVDNQSSAVVAKTPPTLHHSDSESVKSSDPGPDGRFSCSG